MSDTGMLSLAVPPQIHARRHTASHFWVFSAALSPLVIQELWLFSLPALYVLLACTLASAGLDYLLARRFAKSGPEDGHAVLTGLLLALLLPPVCSWYIPVFAACAAVGFKWLFGSYQSYPIHPVLFGWAFAQLNWASELVSAWVPTPQGPDHVSEPFRLLQNFAGMNPGEGPFQIVLSHGDYPAFRDAGVTDFLNDHVFSLFSARLPSGYLDAFAGLAPFAMGAGSAFLVMLVSVILYSRRLASWQAPAGMFLAFFALVYVCGGLPFGQGLLQGDVLFFLGSGTFTFCLLILAADYTSNPYSIRGRFIYGAVAGGLAAIFLLFSLSSWAPLIALMCTDLLVFAINRLCSTGRKGRKI